MNATAQSVLAKFRGGALPTYSQRVENDGCSRSQSHEPSGSCHESQCFSSHCSPDPDGRVGRSRGPASVADKSARKQWRSQELHHHLGRHRSGSDSRPTRNHDRGAGVPVVHRPKSVGQRSAISPRRRLPQSFRQARKLRGHGGRPAGPSVAGSGCRAVVWRHHGAAEGPGERNLGPSALSAALGQLGRRGRLHRHL